MGKKIDERPGFHQNMKKPYFFSKWQYHFGFVKVGMLYWRASKQSKWKKLIPAKQCETKSLWKGDWIDFVGYVLMSYFKEVSTTLNL